MSQWKTKMAIQSDTATQLELLKNNTAWISKSNKIKVKPDCKISKLSLLIKYTVTQKKQQKSKLNNAKFVSKEMNSNLLYLLVIVREPVSMFILVVFRIGPKNKQKYRWKIIKIVD